MENELISIVVPIYKVEKYLKKCVDSIQNQTYKNIEIILVDDESPDNCGKMCDEYSKYDERIKVIHKKNGGLSDARNAGIEVATGKYIGFVDSDDYIKEDMYENLYNNMKKSDSDISICGYIEYQEGSKIVEKDLNDQTKIYTNKDAIEKLLYNDKITDHAWNKLYKLELFKENDIRYPKGFMYEDIGTTYLLFENAKKISYNEKIGYYYLRRENSILGKINKKLIFDLLKMTNDRFEYLKNKFPDLNNKLIENKMKFINKIFRYICISNNKELLKNNLILYEYDFYRNNFKLTKNYILKIQKSNFEKIECYILYLNKDIYWVYYRVKNILKKLKERVKNV